ncbi:hypothetical protein C8J57DRAFT_1252796 [Mycena rebaudengoi]|nr:hypothetical protein C8J57DRAFT_1252796 [Mycena rebaudengoi]
MLLLLLLLVCLLLLLLAMRALYSAMNAYDVCNHRNALLTLKIRLLASSALSPAWIALASRAAVAASMVTRVYWAIRRRCGHCRLVNQSTLAISQITELRLNRGDVQIEATSDTTGTTAMINRERTGMSRGPFGGAFFPPPFQTSGLRQISPKYRTKT